MEKKFFEIISGGEIKLRPIDWETMLEDAKSIVKWASDPEVANALRYLAFFQGKTTLGRQLKYFSRMINSPTDQVFIIETELGEFLGTCGLHDIDQVNDNVRIGIIIFNKHFWKRGYGKLVVNLLLAFAFDKLNMNKAYLTPRVDNKLAIHIYKKLGFQEEGILRKEYRVSKGEYIDLLRMSILKKNYLSLRGLNRVLFTFL